MDLLDVMTITVTDPGQARLAVSGEVDATNALRLRQAIVDAGIASWADVEVDLAGVTFMDSTGLRALAAASVELAPVELVLCAVPRQLSRILEITGICTGLRCVPREGVWAQLSSRAERDSRCAGRPSGVAQW
jgi:anti-sigma B factor antagonist